MCRVLRSGNVMAGGTTWNDSRRQIGGGGRRRRWGWGLVTLQEVEPTSWTCWFLSTNDLNWLHPPGLLSWKRRKNRSFCPHPGLLPRASLHILKIPKQKSSSTVFSLCLPGSTWQQVLGILPGRGLCGIIDHFTKTAIKHWGENLLAEFRKLSTQTHLVIFKFINTISIYRLKTSGRLNVWIICSTTAFRKHTNSFPISWQAGIWLMKGAGRWLAGCWVNNGPEQQGSEKWEANWRQIKVGARRRGHAETRNSPLTNVPGFFFPSPSSAGQNVD